MATTRRGFIAGAAVSKPRAAIRPVCLANIAVHCQACGDACGTQAILFRRRLGGPPLPDLVADRCTGCGDCVTVCPVAAIHVVPAGG